MNKLKKDEKAFIALVLTELVSGEFKGGMCDLFDSYYEQLEEVVMESRCLDERCEEDVDRADQVATKILNLIYKTHRTLNTFTVAA